MKNLFRTASFRVPSGVRWCLNTGRNPACPGLKAHGFSLVELMVAVAIGLFLTGAIISVFLAHTRINRSSTSQASIQNIENAISALITPVVRASGFNGCSSLTQALSNLNPGGPAPLGNLGTSSSLLAGYEANGTHNGDWYVQPPDNSPNEHDPSKWTPALDSTLSSRTQAGSDVLVVLGAATGASPIGVTANTAGSTAVSVQDSSGLTAGQFAIVSDCLKASIFQITNVTTNSVAHTAGSGALANSTDTLAVNYPPGAQFIPLQQTAFYIGQGTAGQRTLMRATFSNGNWTEQPLVPGVESMQIVYGIGSAGMVSKYVDAGAVTDWSQVYAIRIGFLIQGQAGSGVTTSAGTFHFPVLDLHITVSSDGKLRHVYEMTIDLRNAT